MMRSVLLTLLVVMLTGSCVPLAPTATPAPTVTPAPTATLVPTATPAPTVTPVPVPTATPMPTLSSAITASEAEQYAGQIVDCLEENPEIRQVILDLAASGVPESFAVEKLTTFLDEVLSSRETLALILTSEQMSDVHEYWTLLMDCG